MERFQGVDKNGGSVKNIYEILRQKESDCARVQAEIDALRMVIPLLGEEQPASSGAPEPEQEGNSLTETQPSGTEGPSFSELAGHGSGFWKRRR